MYIFFILIIIAGILCSCTTVNNDYKSVLIGVVETNNTISRSFITLLDDDFKKVKTETVNKAQLCSVSSYAKVYDNNVFMLPLGINGDNNKEEACILSKSFKDGSINEYNIGEVSIRDFAVTGNNIFTINTKIENGKMISVLSKLNYDTNKLSKINIDDIVLECITSTNKHLIITGMNYSKNDELFSKVYIINPHTLEIIKVLDSTNFGISFAEALIVNNTAYLSPRTKIGSDDKSTEELATHLVELDLTNYSLNSYNSKIGALNQIKILNEETLLINCYDEVQDVGNCIATFDLKEKTFSYLVTDDTNRQNEVKDNDIFTLTPNSINKYNIIGNKIIKQKSKKLTSNTDGFSYFSSFYLVPNE